MQSFVQGKFIDTFSIEFVKEGIYTFFGCFPVLLDPNPKANTEYIVRFAKNLEMACFSL